MKFPNIDPVALSLGPVEIRWYGVAYVTGIILAYIYAIHIVKKKNLTITKTHLENFLSWTIIAIIVGGRLGFTLIYDPLKYLMHPIKILQIYKGGMSFHGGMIGLAFATYIYSKKYKLPFLTFIDIIAVVSPIGLFLGRIVNFINAELYGRITDVSWGVIFPGEILPRHPSQLYEALAEGFVLLIIMSVASLRYNTLRFPGRTSGIFLVCYSLFRIMIENFREPDEKIGFILSYLTMGQILSSFMFILGLYLLTIKLQSKSVR
ncbi:MAG: prolipoprotein diacylglyceryl transferase [Rickettsiaceae bacterium]